MSTTAREVQDHALAASFQQRRAPVYAYGGMVGTGHPLATAAGLDILRRGGNAMDAAIAAALVTTVVLPGMCSLGGDAFYIHADGKTGKVTAVNSSGIAPRALSRDYFVKQGHEKMPFYGPNSFGVPGTVAAVFEAINSHCRLGVDDLFQHAIHYAEDGYPLSVSGSRTINATAAELAKSEAAAAIFLRDGKAIPAGQTLKQTNVAQSLREVAEGGPDHFYRGDLGKRIVEAMRSYGSEVTLEDFADHVHEVYEPISTTYRGVTVYQTGLPTQGHIVLEELNILEQADLAGMGMNSADAIHLMVEAKKRAFADRNAYSRDPKFGYVPIETMLSKEFAAERYASIDMQRASTEVDPGALPESDGNTTYLCTADAEGNMVSFIHSLSAGFGSQVVAGDTGILLNNRVGRGFSLVEGHPNVIEGGKRTMHTLNCFALARDGQVYLVGGTPGGDQQPQWNMQVISHLVDHGLDPQAAVEVPRWQSFPGSDPINLPNPFVLRAEESIGEGVLDDLAARGHDVQRLAPFAAGGSFFVIARDGETGALLGGGDPRSEGVVLGI